MNIQPLETTYNGYRFRSRLEARWAVYFDSLKLNYDYELEGFAVGTAAYLPDFWLGELKCWAEVKPTWEHVQEKMVLFQNFATAINQPLLFLVGTPALESYKILMPSKKKLVNFTFTRHRNLKQINNAIIAARQARFGT